MSTAASPPSMPRAIEDPAPAIPDTTAPLGPSCAGARSRRRTRGSVRGPDPPAASGRRSVHAMLDRGRQRRLRGHFRVHEAVRAARPQGPRGRRADHRGDRRQLRGDPARRLRERRQPAQVRRRCAAALVRGRGSRRARMSRDRPDAPGAARRRPDRGARRKGHAADVAGRAFGMLPFLRGGHVPFRVPAGRPRLEPARRDGARGRRRRDRGQPGDGRAPAEPLPGRVQGAGAAPAARASRATRTSCRSSRGRRCPPRRSRVACRRRSRPRARRRRNVRAPPGHDRLHPFRGDRRADRTAAARRRPPRRCIDW